MANRVTKEDVPEEFIRLVERRYLPLLLNWRLMNHDFKALLASVYLQGVNDTVTLFSNRPDCLKELGGPEIDYQI